MTLRRFGLALSLAVFATTALAAGAAAHNAYVVNREAGTVSVVNTATNKAEGVAIPVGKLPSAIAITPDGKTAYVANTFSDTVSVIDTATNKVAGQAIDVGKFPRAIAITPDGQTAYVANNGSHDVSVIDTATNQAAPSTIAVGAGPEAIAITPDGKSAYVASEVGTVSRIDTVTNEVEGEAIHVGAFPNSIAITRDGSHAYVVNTETVSGTVSVIDIATNEVERTIPIGSFPQVIAITPDGKTAYVGNGNGTVAVIDIATNDVAPEAIEVGKAPSSIAIAPDGKVAYIGVGGSKHVSVLNVATGKVEGQPIEVEGEPSGIAINPVDQRPRAAFRLAGPRARPGMPLGFDASASRDPDGLLASFGWTFGDQQSATLTNPVTSHTYAAPGTYQATLTVTDDEGARALAGTTMTVEVAYPGVRLRCPKSAKPRGCRFKLQVIAKKPKKGRRAKAQSAIARANVKPGRSAILSLVPKEAFREKLAVATRVLVRQTTQIGASKSVRYRRLAIVQ